MRVNYFSRVKVRGAKFGTGIFSGNYSPVGVSKLLLCIVNLFKHDLSASRFLTGLRGLCIMKTSG